jgi:DNA-binding NarL/FixJ family response regulator
LHQSSKKILSGGRYVSTSLAEKLIANLDESVDKPLHELLSDREHEVMKMIAAGVPLTEIGDRLHVSVKTISSYRARIMEKMQMKSNADLTRYAMTHGLIE